MMQGLWSVVLLLSFVLSVTKGQRHLVDSLLSQEEIEISFTMPPINANQEIFNITIIGKQEKKVDQWNFYMTYSQYDDTNVLQEFHYYLMNQKGFYYTNDNMNDKTCLQPSQVPPLHLIKDSLGNSKIIHGSSKFCEDSSSTMLEATFSNEAYTLCLTERNSTNNHLIGTVYSKFFEKPMTIRKSKRENLFWPIKNLEKCPTLSVSVEPFRRLSSSSTTSIDTTDIPASGSCTTCRGKTRQPCLFVHGAGRRIAGPVTNTYEEYWGQIHAHSPCCTVIKFMRMQTQNASWTDSNLHQEFCNAALSLSSSPSRAIENVTLVAHSMGNNIIAASVVNNVCKLGNTAKWVALQGPIRGSEAAARVSGYCEVEGSIQQKMLRIYGSCPNNRAINSLLPPVTKKKEKRWWWQRWFYQSSPKLKKIDEAYDSIAKVYQARVSAVLCGTSIYGIATSASLKFKFMNSVIRPFEFNFLNDGMVALHSCQAGIHPSVFKKSFTSKFYEADVNHADGTFRNGDGWWGDSRKPRKWFSCLAL